MKSYDKYGDEEIARRRDELAKRMLNMQPRPLKPKSKDGTKASPLKKRRVAKEGKSVGETMSLNIFWDNSNIWLVGQGVCEAREPGHQNNFRIHFAKLLDFVLDNRAVSLCWWLCASK